MLENAKRNAVKNFWRVVVVMISVIAMVLCICASGCGVQAKGEEADQETVAEKQTILTEKDDENTTVAENKDVAAEVEKPLMNGKVSLTEKKTESEDEISLYNSYVTPNEDVETNSVVEPSDGTKDIDEFNSFVIPNN